MPKSQIIPARLINQQSEGSPQSWGGVPPRVLSIVDEVIE